MRYSRRGESWRGGCAARRAELPSHDSFIGKSYLNAANTAVAREPVATNSGPFPEALTAQSARQLCPAAGPCNVIYASRRAPNPTLAHRGNDVFATSKS